MNYTLCAKRNPAYSYTLATIVNGIPKPLDDMPRNLSFMHATAIAARSNETFRDLINSGSIKPVVAYNIAAQ